VSNRFIAGLLLAALLFSAALLPQTAEAEDEASEFIFGTRLVIISPAQITSPNYGWWADKLPMEYSYAIGTIIKTVNAEREARGETRMVDYKSYPITIGGETQTDLGWEYSVDFQRMLPVDLDVVMAAYPLTGELADLKTELRPVSNGYFWASTQDGSPVTLELPGSSMTIEAADGYSAIWDRISSTLKAYFGREVKFDLGMNRFRSAAGYDSFDVNLTIYMDDTYMNGDVDKPYYAD
jgi:hypothetical protein